MDEVERLVQSIMERRNDNTQNEPDWLRLACAFANELEEEDRVIFRRSASFILNMIHGKRIESLIIN